MSDRYPTTAPDQAHFTGHDNVLRPLTEEHFSALDRAVARTRSADAPDLRTEARRQVDELHEIIKQATIKQYGRAPSLESWDQTDRTAVLLSRAKDAETAFIAASSNPGTPPEHVQQLKKACSEAFQGWVNAATAGWPSAKVHKEQALRQQRDAWSR